MRFSVKIADKPLYAVQESNGEAIICNCPEFILDSLKEGKQVRALSHVRQKFEQGRIVKLLGDDLYD